MSIIPCTKMYRIKALKINFRVINTVQTAQLSNITKFFHPNLLSKLEQHLASLCYIATEFYKFDFSLLHKWPNLGQTNSLILSPSPSDTIWRADVCLRDCECMISILQC